MRKRMRKSWKNWSEIIDDDRCARDATMRDHRKDEKKEKERKEEIGWVERQEMRRIEKR